MATWGDYEIQIYNNSEPHVLQGTITTGVEGSGSFGINDIGDGFFTFPADDNTAKGLVQENRIAVGRMYNNVSSQWCIIFCIEVSEIKPQIGRPTYVYVSGPGRLNELLKDNLNYGLVSDGSGNASSTWAGDIIAFANKTWTINAMGSVATTGYLQAAEETVYDALVEVSQQKGHAITYHPANAPERKIGFIRENLSGSGVFDWDDLDLSQPSNPSTIENDATKAVIRKLDIDKQASEIVTRVYGYGSGLGAGRFTIEEADGFVTLPSGFTANYATGLITNTTLEAVAEQLPVTRIKQFSHIKPETTDDTDPNYTASQQTAAVQLVEAVVQFMQERTGDKVTFYHVEAMCHGNYTPGQLVNIDFSNSEYTVNGNFILHTIEHTIQGRERISHMTLSTALYRERPEHGVIVIKKIKEIEEVLRHATSNPNPSSPGGNPTSADATMILVTNHPAVPNRRIAANGNGTVVSDGGAGGNFSWGVNVSADLGNVIDVDPGLLDLETQTANLIFAGPTGGGAAKPDFRLLVDADIPASIARDSELHNPITLDSDVALIFDLNDQQITLNNQNANLVFAGPASGGADDPAFRFLVFADIPTDSDPTGQAVLATDANGRFGAEGLGLGTAPDGDYLKVADNGIIGLGNGAAGHIQFDNQATDEINFLNCFVGIGTSTPDRLLDVRGAGGIARFGDGTGYASVLINGAAGNGRDLIFQSGGVNRWILRTNSDSESGGDAGSNFRILSRTDSGSALDEVLSLDRETGQAEFASRLSLNGRAWSDAWQNYGLSVYLDSSTTFGAVFGDPAVDHGITTYAPTEAFLALRNRSTTQGGAVISGYSENATALVLEGLATGEDTSDDTGSTGAVTINAAKKSGTGIASLSSTGNVVVAQNNGTGVWIVKGNGDIHRDGNLATFDGVDDIQVARAFNEQQNPERAGNWARKNPAYDRQKLVDLDIMSNIDPADGNQYNESALVRLAVGAVVQNYDRIMDTNDMAQVNAQRSQLNSTTLTTVDSRLAAIEQVLGL